MKVLFLSANAGMPGRDREIPSEGSVATQAQALAWLNIDREYNSVQVALGFPGLQGESVVEMIPDVQWDQMRTLLRARSKIILHFSGHGGPNGALYMKKNDGTVAPVANETLVRLVGMHRDNIALIVLNACYTAEIAERLTTVVDVVVGMESRVRDDAAILFSRVFYDELVANGASIARAFEAAGDAVTHEYGPGVAPAVIKARIGIDPTTIRPFEPLHDPDRDRALATQIGKELGDLVQQQVSDPNALPRLAVLEASFAALLRGIDIAMPDARARPPSMRILEDYIKRQIDNAKLARQALTARTQVANPDSLMVTR